MLALLRTQQLYFIRHAFKVDQFKSEDYKTMCHLLKQKYSIHNEQIKAFKDIKLLDEKNKLIGMYPASEARKKAASMKKDITLVNSNSNPIICRVVEFRNNLLNKFFEEIVYKHNEKLLSRASSVKELKIALNLNNNELKVKSKQIIELSKKNLKVRVFMNCKQDNRDECLQKLELLKSDIQGKCLIEQDIKNYRQDTTNSEGQSTINKRQTQTYSFVCKSRQNQFINMLQQSSEKAPEEAIENFLKKFYKQEDVDMQDLNVSAKDIASDIDFNTSSEEQSSQETKSSKSKTEVQGRTKGKGVLVPSQPITNSIFERQARAQVLNQRLKNLLGWTS